MSNTIDSVIFDIDGTLWDSRAICADAWNAVFAKADDISLSVTAETLRHEFGKPLPVIAEDLIHGVSKERQLELMQMCLDAEDAFLRKNPPAPYSGLEAALEQLVNSGKKLFIVSNGHAGYGKEFIELTGLNRFFTDERCHGDNGLNKTENIRLLIDTYKLQGAVYVGDIQADCDATHAAHIPFCYAAYGFGTADDPEYTIQDISELPNILDEPCC